MNDPIFSNIINNSLYVYYSETELQKEKFVFIYSNKSKIGKIENSDVLTSLIESIKKDKGILNVLILTLVFDDCTYQLYYSNYSKLLGKIRNDRLNEDLILQLLRDYKEKGIDGDVYKKYIW